MTYQELSYLQVGLAALLILVNGALSVALRLGLHRRLLVAAVRSVAQLLLVGLVLDWVFAADRWIVVVAMSLFMVTVAGFAAVGRVERRFPGIRVDSVVSMWASSWIVAAAGLFVILDVEPWFAPQYSIPLLGMILGNTLTGVSLGLDRFGAEVAERRDEVEGWLALGATRWEAARASVRSAVRTGMVPILNSMVVVGLVSLPGMMTGQLLAGVAPQQAVRYQVVILFLIASATGLGTTAVVLLAYRRLFDANHRFLHDRLRSR